MAMSSYKASAKRLLKCFCGCKEMTEHEVQRIYQLNVQATLKDPQAISLLKTFMKISRSGNDKSPAEQFVYVYEHCGEYIKLKVTKLTSDQIKELSDMGLPYELEKDLDKNNENGDISCCLLRIQHHLRNEIELSGEYKDFKDAILKKLDQRV